jgi:HAD superfamily hydrolase (TIGR01509 family)
MGPSLFTGEKHLETAKMPTGILLDLDGVLWDSERVHATAFDEVCSEHGFEVIEYKDLAGRPTREAFEIILKHNKVEVGRDKLQRLIHEKQIKARERLAQQPPLSKDLGALHTLFEYGHRVAVVTGASAQTAQIFVEASNMTFTAVITAETTERGKPAPDPYLAGAKALGIAPSVCWALDDSEQGLQSAVGAGTRAVHFRYSTLCSLGHLGTSLCVSSLREFVDLVVKNH